jgi:hypothetical protein
MTKKEQLRVELRKLKSKDMVILKKQIKADKAAAKRRLKDPEVPLEEREKIKRSLGMLPKYVCRCCGTHNESGYNFKTKFTCTSCARLSRVYKKGTIVGLYSLWEPKVYCKCCGSSENPIEKGKVCEVCLGHQIKLGDGFLKWAPSTNSPVKVIINNTTYQSISIAASTLGLNYSEVYKAAVGILSHTHGYIVDIVPQQLQIEDIENYRPSGSFKGNI